MRGGECETFGIGDFGFVERVEAVRGISGDTERDSSCAPDSPERRLQSPLESPIEGNFAFDIPIRNTKTRGVGTFAYRDGEALSRSIWVSDENIVQLALYRLYDSQKRGGEIWHEREIGKEVICTLEASNSRRTKRDF